MSIFLFGYLLIAQYVFLSWFASVSVNFIYEMVCFLNNICYLVCD
jgi:hypothetical protein